MSPVFESIKEILTTYFNNTATYSGITIDAQTKYLVIDVEKQFIYGTNLPPTNPQSTLKTSYAKSGTLAQTPFAQSGNITYIFFQPIDTTNYSSQYTSTFQDVVVAGETYKQETREYYNQYHETFNLIFYTKSLSNTTSREAFLFSEMFFNAFRGNLPIASILHNHNVFNFTFNNYKVQNLSGIENQNGVSRYQASFTAKYTLKTNTNIIDNLKTIVIDKVTVF